MYMQAVCESPQQCTFPESLSSYNLVEDANSEKQSYWSKRNKGFCLMNSESLQLCTEGLGFESLDGVEDLKNNATNSRLDSSNMTSMHSIGSFKKAKNCIRSFPPPISSLGRTGKALVRFKSYRQDGRFVLQVVRIPKQDYLHAYREDGRLRLSFVQTDEEKDQEDDQVHEEEHAKGTF